MAKIPFDIKYRPQIESGEYRVVTASNYPVRILKWDAKNICVPIIYSYIDGVGEYCAQTSGRNLFIVTPEPELTNWEKFISGCLQKHGLLDCGAADRIAKECSAELLDLARKQLIEEQYTSDPRKTDLYKLGKAEALKDLPRWRKCAAGPKPMPSNEWIFSIDSENVTRGSVIVHKGYFLPLDGLEKLPKED